MSTLILPRKDIKGLLNMSSVIEVVEEAFAAYAIGKAKMPPKSYLVVGSGDFRAMPASLPGAVGLKWVSVHPQNQSLGLPTVMAILIYNDPATGYPLAIMDATEITAYRTGAAAAVASKYLARKDSTTLGLIGAGRQAHTQLMAHTELFHFEEVRAYDRSSAAVRRLIEAFPQFPIRETSLMEAAGADIVCTVTPAREPVLMKSHVIPGTHINAVGADAEGKEELEPSILKQAIVVVDDLAQAREAGEINVPVRKGLFRVEEVYATLAQVVSGQKPLHRDKRDVTVFDSTGVAIEDIAVAKHIYDNAKEDGHCLAVDLIGE